MKSEFYFMSALVQLYVGNYSSCYGKVTIFSLHFSSNRCNDEVWLSGGKVKAGNGWFGEGF